MKFTSRLMMSTLISCGLVSPAAFASTPAAPTGEKSTIAETPKFNIAREVWFATIAHMVAYQPNAVGFAGFADAVGVDRNSSGGKKLMRMGIATKNYPTIAADGDTLVVSYPGDLKSKVELRMQMVADAPLGTFNVNGREFKFDLAKTTTEDFTVFFRETLTPQKSAGLADLFLSPANANENSQVGFVGALGSAIGTYGTLIATVASGTAGAAVVVATVGIGATGGHFYCSLLKSGVNDWSDYLNCMTTPLSAVGMNPRDNMFLKDLKCQDGSFSVRVESSTGNSQYRTFEFNDGKLKAVKVDAHRDSKASGGRSQFNYDVKKSRFESAEIDIENRNGPGKYLRPRNDKDLDQAQALVRDAVYYQELCADPERRADVLRQIQSGNTKVKAYEGKSNSELIKTSK